MLQQSTSVPTKKETKPGNAMKTHKKRDGHIDINGSQLILRFIMSFGKYYPQYPQIRAYQVLSTFSTNSVRTFFFINHDKTFMSDLVYHSGWFKILSNTVIDIQNHITKIVI